MQDNFSSEMSFKNTETDSKCNLFHPPPPMQILLENTSAAQSGAFPPQKVETGTKQGCTKFGMWHPPSPTFTILLGNMLPLPFP